MPLHRYICILLPIAVEKSIVSILLCADFSYTPTDESNGIEIW